MTNVFRDLIESTLQTLEAGAFHDAGSGGGVAAAGGIVLLGFELLHYRPANAEAGLAVETVVRTSG